MNFGMFANYFPEIAENETLSIKIKKSSPNLEAGTYTFFDMYCEESNCDCRIVNISIYSVKEKAEMACLTFGFENKDLSLTKFFADSESAKILLHIFKTEHFQDKEYIEMLKQHYRLFKDKIDKKVPSKNNGARKKMKKLKRK